MLISALERSVLAVNAINKPKDARGRQQNGVLVGKRGGKRRGERAQRSSASQTRIPVVSFDSALVFNTRVSDVYGKLGDNACRGCFSSRLPHERGPVWFLVQCRIPL